MRVRARAEDDCAPNGQQRQYFLRYLAATSRTGGNAGRGGAAGRGSASSAALLLTICRRLRPVSIPAEGTEPTPLRRSDAAWFRRDGLDRHHDERRFLSEVRDSWGCSAQTTLNRLVERLERQGNQCSQGPNASWLISTGYTLSQRFVTSSIGKRRQGVVRVHPRNRTGDPARSVVPVIHQKSRFVLT